MRMSDLKFMKCGIEERESTVLRNDKLKIAIHQFFVKCENKNCEVLSKNWKNLHLTMLILACTNYIS